MKKALRIILIIITALCIVITYNRLKYPPIDKLPRSNGMIHHPTYGDYPEEVEFYQGMDIMPGQSAVFEVIIPFKEK